MKILITGGAGYIGSILIPELLNEGHEVTVLDNFVFRQNSLLNCCHFDKFKIIKGDCREENVIKPLLKKAEIIIPLAALVGMPMCAQEPITAKTVNQDAIEMICRLASSEQWIIYPTTNSGYGIGQKNKFCTEETPLNPISLYGESKMYAENAVLDRKNSLTFRLATVFGASPRMRMDLLVNDFVYRAVYDKAVVIFEGHFKRNFIHIRDVARGFIHSINNFEKMKGRAYNLGLEDANLSKIELCEKIKKQLVNFIYLEESIGEDPDKRDYIVSNKRILETGFTPSYDLDNGIKELIKAYTIIKNNQYTNI